MKDGKGSFPSVSRVVKEVIKTASRRSMKKFLWFAGIALAVSGLGQAAVIPCVSGSFASYVALSSMGCSVNDQQFFGFANLNVPVGSTAIAPGSITVTPITTGFSPGLLFTLNLTAGTRQTLEAFLAFDVAPLPGGNVIAGSLLSQNGGSATGDGGVVGIETICLGAAVSATGSCPGTPASRNLGTFALSGINPQTSDSLNFAARQRLLGLTGDFSAAGGTNGTASVTSFGIQVNTVPEPATILITGLAIAGLGLMRRKKQVESL